jgi:hypothetical protein
METTTGDKIILQIVPSIAENVLDYFEGETVIRWKNLTLKRLEDQDICIWQQVTTNDKHVEKKIDSSLFLPQVDAIVIFYEIHDKTTIVEWLRTIVTDIRLKNVTPIIVGCYQKGENTKDFKELFKNDINCATSSTVTSSSVTSSSVTSSTVTSSTVRSSNNSNNSRIFLWRIDQGEEDIVDIYQRILSFL